MEDCPVCGNEMEHTDTDSRQEWTKEIYYCDTCNNEFGRTITYKIQSSRVASDKWDHTKKQLKDMIGKYNEEVAIRERFIRRHN
jgi:transposase-like protein